ncbi:MAG: 30S ribosome-binding factor RbfA [Gammaproteobacteria bacterium]|nr:30S ribosome-binding factor RbfA [Gammaproteobacteria bacterium]
MGFKEYNRTDRIGEQLKRELSELIAREFEDPALFGVTVAEVRVTTDLKYAKVYVSSLNLAAGIDTDFTPVLETLHEYGGRMRSILGKRLRLRTIPEFRFYEDTAMAHGVEMTSLIDEVVAEDQARHQDDSNES